MHNMPTAHFSGIAESFLGRGAHATAHIFFDATWEQVVGEQVRLLDAYMLRHTCYTVHSTPYMLHHTFYSIHATPCHTLHALHTYLHICFIGKHQNRERERERKREKGKSKLHTGQTDRQTGRKHEDRQIVKADNDGRE